MPELTNEIRKHLTCPLSWEVMTDPVMTTLGQTYERTEITQWLSHNNTDPMTGALLTDKSLTSNYAMKGLLDLYNDELEEIANTPYTLEEFARKIIAYAINGFPSDDDLGEGYIMGMQRNYSVQQTVSHPALQGLQYQEVPGDGHCLFHAIGLYLGEDANFLRRIVSAHMEENFDEYKIYRQGDDETFRNYIKAIRNGAEWGDHIEIEIIQRITDRPVVIIHPDGNPTIPNNLDTYQGHPIFIY
jgi:U-box domain/OTU-like cysteine protease